MAKKPISIRLEADLLAWFKQAAPEGYQTMIQAALREYQQRWTKQERAILARAQLIFLQYHARCFWHLRQDLEITSSLLPLIQSGLREYGGLEGMRLAAELDLKHVREGKGADHSISTIRA